MKTLAFLFLFVAGAGLLSAQDANRWAYFQDLDGEGRVAYIKNTPAVQTDGDFLLRALAAVDADRIETGSDLAVVNKKALAQLLVQFLADLKTPGAAAMIARIPTQYRDPVLRGESWLALAKLGYESSVPSLVRELTAANESGGRTRGEEIQAAYLVQALGLFKAPEAFRAVSAATVAWYAPVSGVKQQAKRVLPLLVPDVEAATLDLLAKEDNLAVREALYQSLTEEGDAAKTARAASAVLSTLVSIQSQDRTTQDRIVRLTLACLLGAQKAPSPPASLLTPLKTLMKPVQGQETLIQSIRLLAKIDDPDAVSLLAATLSRYNEQQKSGTNKSQDLLTVKELFTALGATGKSAARAPLNEAKFVGYAPGTVRDAQDALDKLPRE